MFDFQYFATKKSLQNGSSWFWWAELDLNQRCLTRTDLQPGAIPNTLYLPIWWHLRDLNPALPDWKSSVLTIRLRCRIGDSCENWTRISGFRIRRRNHLNKEPCGGTGGTRRDVIPLMKAALRSARIKVTLSPVSWSKWNLPNRLSFCITAQPNGF